MNEDHQIYELTDEDKQALFFSSESLQENMSEEKKSKLQTLLQDTARLDGYLKGRADSDRPHLGIGLGKASGAGSNKDLVG